MFAVILSVAISKLSLILCRLIHKAGSNKPGDVALFFCPDILTHLSQGVNCILVTGTNGKTTTAAMIRKIFDSQGIRVIANKEGSNLQSGMIVPFLRHCDLPGRSSRSIAVLECDEKWVPLAFREVKPKTMVITNLSDDQTDRTQSPEALYQMLLSCAQNSDVTLCINTSCPVSGQMIKENLPNRIVPFCAQRNSVSVDGCSYPAALTIPGDYNMENAAAAAAACLSFGISCEASLSALKDFQAPFGRMETFSIDGIPATICLTKNVVSADNVLSYIESTVPEAQIVFGFNTNPGDGADRTWIKKINIHPGMRCLEDAIASGDCTEDIAGVLTSAGFCCRKGKTPEDVLSLIRSSTRHLYFLANYTYMMEIRHLFAENGYLKDFWLIS